MRNDTEARSGSTAGKHSKRPGDRWRGLIFAAGVALHQVGANVDREERITPPYVLLLPDNRSRFSQRELIGDTILTDSLDLLDPNDIRLAGNQN